MTATVTARSMDGGDARPFVSTPADPRFGEGLRLLGLEESLQDHRNEVALRQIAALHELAALQNLAALANWPEPSVEAPRSAPVSRPAPRPAQPQAWTDASYSAAVLDELNALRARSGLAPVQADGRITSASSSYALKMIATGSFGHSVDGSTITSRLAAAGFSEPVYLGEVLAYGSGAPSPASIVQMWMDSPAHREQILSGTYWRGGAGCAFSGGNVHCVVDLAS
jgi:uncharacterized protein YkwD